MTSLVVFASDGSTSKQQDARCNQPSKSAWPVSPSTLLLRWGVNSTWLGGE